MKFEIKYILFKKKKRGVEVEAIEDFFGKRSICNLKKNLSKT